MKIVLATGIYPPEIGGPATYVHHLAEEFSKRGDDVTVITYGEFADGEVPWKVMYVPSSGGPLLRWRRFARVLRQYGKDADVIECFSSVSCGIPLALARLRKAKKILRLGGDFLWERYTDVGGRCTLKQFYRKRWLGISRWVMRWILRTFDHVVFSTEFQRRLYERSYKNLPKHSVIENALARGEGTIHEQHDPLQLLFLGRFVRFKNLDRLLRAVARIPLVTLTLVGEGPEKQRLSGLARMLELQGRVTFAPSAGAEHVRRIFSEHDVLILPSLTEISPNVALEARSSGLPVLLTEEHGLSEELFAGMTVRPLLSATEITKAILEAEQNYASIARAAATPLAVERPWSAVAQDHLELFRSLLS